MRPALAVALLGLLAVALQGALADLLPRSLVPELGLLATLAAALLLGPASGMLVAFAVGLAADTLSGALLGQNALLHLVAFAVTGAVGKSLDLGRLLPLVVFAWALVAGHVLASLGISWLFLGPLPVLWQDVSTLAPRVLVSGGLAPFTTGLARRLLRRLDERADRRAMRLDTRRPAF